MEARAPGARVTHPASDPEIPEFTLPDGTVHGRLSFGELLSFEQEQGGYWLWQGEEKIFVRVVPAGKLGVRHHIRRHRLLHQRERDGLPGPIRECRTVACKTALWRLEVAAGNCWRARGWWQGAA